MEFIDSMEDVDSMKVDGTNASFFSVSISFMVILSKSCLCIRIFQLYGNQPRSRMDFLLDSNSDNYFTQSLLVIGMISVESNSISPIICSI